jgi:hypothetical protein
VGKYKMWVEKMWENTKGGSKKCEKDDLFNKILYLCIFKINKNEKNSPAATY